MRRNILISLGAILLILVGFLLFFKMSKIQDAPLGYSTTPVVSLFSKEADEAFVSALVSNIDLNSGITMDKATTLFPEQANNVTFAVFNHTDEPIIFPDQGFGLIVFRYDDINNFWEELKLQYVPYREVKILPPNLEKWDVKNGNTWDILESETIAFGVEQLRIYVSGKGQKTNKIYSAYLDVPIVLSP